MARPGRRPKPDALKKLQGNPGKRPLPKSSARDEPPDAPPRALAAPSFLSQAEKRIWDSQVRALEQLKFVRPSDVKALGRFVKFQALFEAIAPHVKAGEIVETTTSDKVTMERLSKRFLALIHLDKRLLAYDAEFGTTPAGRQALLAQLASRQPQLPLDNPAPQPAGATDPAKPANAPAPAPAMLPSPIGLGRVLN